MRHTLAYVLCACLLSTLSGCDFYFGRGGDDCLYGGGDDVPAEAPAPGLRNPVTGQCEFFGGGGGGTCDPACGPCDTLPTPALEPAPWPSWGLCDSQCSYLGETTCLVTPGCRGAYDEAGWYRECWSTDQSGPIQGGGCADLDAWECSRHDDCIALHTDTCQTGEPPGGDDFVACGLGDFRACADEPVGCYDPSECPDAMYCTAALECLPEPGCETGEVPCDGVCYGFCRPADDRGLCYGVPACDSLPPECPPDSVPGRTESCWTGACIPVEQCPPMP